MKSLSLSLVSVINTTVGLWVSSIVGFDDRGNAVLGAAVRRVVGAELGRALGAKLGGTEGRAVGAMVERTEGCDVFTMRVGATVGCLLGLDIMVGPLALG